MSPARTPAAYTADPQPVGTPHPTSEATSNEMSSSIGMQANSDTTAYSEKVPSVQNPPRSSSPRWNRKVPSRNIPVAAFRPLTHMLWLPVEHGRQAPQAGMYEQTTRSPTETRRTLGPTDSTTPAPS